VKHNLSEKELLKGCLKQDRTCQKQLFERYYSDMLTVCMRYARDEDDAYDILQKGFIKLFSKISLFKGEGTLKSWLQSIMVRTAIDHYRRRQRENRFVAEDELEYIEESEEAVIEPQLAAEEIMKSIQLLPNMHRSVFNLFAIEGYSHREIAEELNITEGTSKWYLCEARKILRRMLEPVYPSHVKEYAA
jgi:RNA polymerase sigma factor (sigma-70 family)